MAAMDDNPSGEKRLTDKTRRTDLLVQNARKGDPVAFHQLVDLYQPSIFRMVYYRVRSKMDEEDITQDVFLRAYENLGRLKSAVVFRSWLYRIATNRVQDYFRVKKLKFLFGFTSIDDDFRESDMVASGNRGPDNMTRRDFWNQVDRLLEKLSKIQKEIFLFRFFDQLTIKEIALAINKNENTVKTHLYRGLKKIRTSEKCLSLMENLL